MSLIDPTDAEIVNIWQTTQTIACVGASANAARPSHYVSQYLCDFGYRVIGINPGLAGQNLFGEPVYASLSDIPSDIQVDMIDVFRRPEHIPNVVDEALSCLPYLKTVWMQLGISNADAARAAVDAGKMTIQDRCPKIEIPRLFGTGNPRQLSS